jgi:hypothetical protein
VLAAAAMTRRSKNAQFPATGFAALAVHWPPRVTKCFFLVEKHYWFLILRVETGQVEDNCFKTISPELINIWVFYLQEA